jgi:eukaryotic-like serine/threonine-protein kinase
MSICKKCKAENPPDSNICTHCDVSLDDSTDFIEFEVKPKQVIADRYEIVQEVGRGAMGVVYKALDKKLERYVALKTLKIDQGSPVKIADFRKRMIFEAKAAAKLRHPNVVVIHDVSEMDKLTIHIAMELIDGLPLSDFIVSGGLTDLDLIIDIIVQICDGINHAHENKIVHRDLKPGNIMLVNKREVKITDFGIAKMTEEVSNRNAEKGFVIGTLPYMSPERFDYINDDPRSDLYAVGIIMYDHYV